MMRRAWLLLGLVLCAVAVGCEAERAGDTPAASTTTTVAAPFGFNNLIDALASAGVPAQPGERASGMPFSVPRRPVDVGTFEIAVYEYDDPATRVAEEATIAMEGWSVNHTPVEWVATPHYWSRGRVIVLYLGDDHSVIDFLSQVLGPEVAIG